MKEKIIKKVITNLSWILENKQLNDKVLKLINDFIEDSEIKILGKNEDIPSIVLIKNNENIKIIFSDLLNDIDIIKTSNDGTTTYTISIKKKGDIITVIESSVNKQRKLLGTDEISERKYKKYINNILTKYTYSKIVNMANENKSYTIQEDAYIIKNGKTCVKIKTTDNESYFKTNSVSNVLFNDIATFEINENDLYIITLEEYNELLMKYKVSMLQLKEVIVTYIENGLKEEKALLISSDDNIIELLINEDYKVLDYKQIKKIVYSDIIVFKTPKVKIKEQ